MRNVTLPPFSLTPSHTQVCTKWHGKLVSKAMEKQFVWQHGDFQVRPGKYYAGTMTSMLGEFLKLI